MFDIQLVNLTVGQFFAAYIVFVGIQFLLGIVVGLLKYFVEGLFND